MKKKTTRTEREWKKCAERWRDYARTLELQRNDALKQIRDTAVGLVEPFHPETWTHNIKMQVDAANFLKKSAANPPSPPWCYE